MQHRTDKTATRSCFPCPFPDFWSGFFGLKKSAAPGVDEVTWTEYAEGHEENLSDLHTRVQTGAYRALPSRRAYIPKADGRQRPLGIAAITDRSSKLPWWQS